MDIFFRILNAKRDRMVQISVFEVLSKLLRDDQVIKCLVPSDIELATASCAVLYFASQSNAIAQNICLLNGLPYLIDLSHHNAQSLVDLPAKYWYTGKVSDALPDGFYDFGSFSRSQLVREDISDPIKLVFPTLEILKNGNIDRTREVVLVDSYSDPSLQSLLKNSKDLLLKQTNASLIQKLSLISGIVSAANNTHLWNVLLDNKKTRFEKQKCMKEIANLMKDDMLEQITADEAICLAINVAILEASESIRFQALEIIKKCLKFEDICEKHCESILELFKKRLFDAESREPSEELRAQLLDLLEMFIRGINYVATEIIDKIALILIKNSKDSYHECTRRCLQIICLGCKKFDKKIKSHAKAMIESASSCLNHRHSVVRAAAIKALGALMFVDIDNLFSVIELFKKAVVTDSPTVRGSVYEVVRSWCLELPERLNIMWMPLPFVFFGLNDEVIKYKDYNSETFRLINIMVEDECRDSMKAILDFSKEDNLVRENIYKMVNQMFFPEFQFWEHTGHVFAFNSLNELIPFVGPFISSYSFQIIRNCFKLASDAEYKAKSLLLFKILCEHSDAKILVKLASDEVGYSNSYNSFNLWLEFVEILAFTCKDKDSIVPMFKLIEDNLFIYPQNTNKQRILRITKLLVDKLDERVSFAMLLHLDPNREEFDEFWSFLGERKQKCVDYVLERVSTSLEVDPIRIQTLMAKALQTLMSKGSFVSIDDRIMGIIEKCLKSGYELIKQGLEILNLLDKGASEISAVSILENLKWKAGSNYALIREKIVTLLSSKKIFQSCFINDIVSCLDEDLISLKLKSIEYFREYAAVAPLTDDEFKKLYTELLKRLDDAHDLVRVNACNETMANALSQISLIRKKIVMENYDKVKNKLTRAKEVSLKIFE
ncbi:hypothetical protein ROZALSC1DRAFT_29299 [Rozella allomycis CSF55]|uniref:ARM repeat-containing protein n=1 Tax=Rozella allomycis (strain CSF55) TaxID=988480 RepID=A0A4V1IZS4_ROZAC|nr:hypothetical protein ROZALSC1DRAFT_29299 [Rozella allomycis CSF55]